MTYNQAKNFLSHVPVSDKPSKINPQVTVSQAVEIVQKAIDASIAKGDGDKPVEYWMEKKLTQVFKNQRRPKKNKDFSCCR